MKEWLKKKAFKIFGLLLSGWSATYCLSYSIWAGIISLLFFALIGVWIDKKEKSKIFENTIFVGTGAIIAFILRALQYLIL